LRPTGSSLKVLKLKKAAKDVKLALTASKFRSFRVLDPHQGMMGASCGAYDSFPYKRSSHLDWPRLFGLAIPLKICV